MNLEALSGEGVACCVVGVGMLLLLGFYSIMDRKNGGRTQSGGENGA